MKPTISAPASIAASRMRSVLMPQILMVRSAIGHQVVGAEGTVGERAGGAADCIEIALEPLALAPELALLDAMVTLRKPGRDATEQDPDQQHAVDDEEQ